MSLSCLISPAVTTAGPLTSISNTLFSSSVKDFNAIFLMFKMIAATSSTTPSIVENSCKTPSIWISVTAVPGSDDNKIRRNEFPKVVP